MKTNDYVTHDIARLLKKEGCDIPCKHYYRSDSDDIFESNWFLYNKQNYDSVECVVPSLWEAQEWIRENYHIFVTPMPYLVKESSTIKYRCLLQIYDKGYIKSIGAIINSSSYNDVLNEGILQALKHVQDGSK